MSPASRMPQVRTTSVIRTDTGRLRTNNEDVVIADDDLGTVILADGMGGYNAGEVASRMAVLTIHEHIKRARLSSSPGSHADDEAKHRPDKEGLTYRGRLLRQAILAAHSAILAAASENRQYTGMGTTVVCCLMDDTQLTIAHVGDSRFYRLRGGELTQLTRDHSLLEELIARGAYDREEAARYIRRNIVTRALGVESGVEVDICEDSIEPGDILLLCSDGLTDMVDDETITRILIEHNDQISDSANELIRMANELGGKDNISVALTRVDSPEEGDSNWARRLVRWLHVG